MGAHGIHDYWLVSEKLDYSDGADTYYIGTIPAKTMTLESAIIVVDEWAGTSPTLDLGDIDDPDAMVDNSDVTQGTIGRYYGDGGDADEYTGKYYPAAKAWVLTIGGTDLTAGEAVAVLHCLDLEDSV